MNDLTGVLQARRLVLSDRIEQLRRMIEIRFVENEIQRLFSSGAVRGSTHLCSGQEAVSVGIGSSTRSDDAVTCTYRGHGHALALGSTPERVFAEICGRSTGCAGGVGGSMHLVEADVGLFPTFAIVGAGLPVACGAALAAKVKGSNQVAIAVFGDGAANIGAFHESLNLAAIWSLPVVFVCENNLYGEYSPLECTTPVVDIASRAAAYAMPGRVIDGQDVDAVSSAVADAVAVARNGAGPTLLEMKTYRYSGHSRSDPATYRRAGELDEWLRRDPIRILADRLTEEGALSSADFEALEESVANEVAAASVAALAAPEPALDMALAHVLAEG